MDSKPTRTTDSIQTAVPPDDGPRYTQNMLRLTKYTKNKLCIKLVFLYTIISRCTVNEILKKIIKNLVETCRGHFKN